MDYVALRQEIISKGLLSRQYGYYTFKILSSTALFCAVAVLLFTSGSLWTEVLLVFGMAFAAMQFGFLGHDAGHQAIFKSKKWNDFFGQLFTGLFIGVGYNYWVNKHNNHHANPNHEEEDPDFSAVFALSEKVAAGRKGLLRIITKFQNFLFIPITGTYFFGMQALSIIHNLKLKTSWRKMFELLILGIHIYWVWALPFLLL